LAIDLYETDTGDYPSGLGDLMTEPSGATGWKGPYLKKKPLDPWGRGYVYKYPGSQNPDGYDLFSTGRDGAEGGDDDIGNWGEEK
jgi:general secretion pathway protein G